VVTSIEVRELPFLLSESNIQHCHPDLLAQNQPSAASVAQSEFKQNSNPHCQLQYFSYVTEEAEL
jgi:hypothetical protein